MINKMNEVDNSWKEFRRKLFTIKYKLPYLYYLKHPKVPEYPDHVTSNFKDLYNSFDKSLIEKYKWVLEAKLPDKWEYKYPPTSSYHDELYDPDRKGPAYSTTNPEKVIARRVCYEIDEEYILDKEEEEREKKLELIERSLKLLWESGSADAYYGSWSSSEGELLSKYEWAIYKEGIPINLKKEIDKQFQDKKSKQIEKIERRKRWDPYVIVECPKPTYDEFYGANTNVNIEIPSIHINSVIKCPLCGNYFQGKNIINNLEDYKKYNPKVKVFKEGVRNFHGELPLRWFKNLKK